MVESLTNSLSKLQLNTPLKQNKEFDKNINAFTFTLDSVKYFTDVLEKRGVEYISGPHKTLKNSGIGVQPKDRADIQTCLKLIKIAGKKK